MQRAATDVMQSILFSAVLDGVAALKRASGGLPNQLLRDVQAIHPNVTFADLPKELAGRDRAKARAPPSPSFLKEGYAVGPRQQMQQSRPMDRVPERQRPGSGDRRGPPRGPAPGASPRRSAAEGRRRRREARRRAAQALTRLNFAALIAAKRATVLQDIHRC